MSKAATPRPVLIIDTREQAPFRFPEETIAVIRRALPAGDYTLEGLEDHVVVERKSLDDLVKTLIQDRERFHRELKKLQVIPGACVVVEAGLNDLLSHQYKSGAHPNAVLGAVLAVMVDFQVPVHFCGSRPAACHFTLSYLLKHQREKGKVDHASPSPEHAYVQADNGDLTRHH